MPSSQHFQISKILDLVILINPESILDIGIGFGKYGMLCREYLELWDGRNNYKDFTRIIDGIEAFKDYITPLHGFIYNNIFIGDASELISTLETEYELVLLIDVLEHFEKEEGAIFIKNILKRNKSLLISVPKLFEKQADSFGNRYEIHRSHWTENMLREFGKLYCVEDDYSIIVFIGDINKIRNGLALRRKLKFNKYKSTILSFTPNFLLKIYRQIKYSIFNRNSIK